MCAWELGRWCRCRVPLLCALGRWRHCRAAAVCAWELGRWCRCRVSLVCAWELGCWCRCRVCALGMRDRMRLGAWALVRCALEVGATAGCRSRVLLRHVSLCALNSGAHTAQQSALQIVAAGCCPADFFVVCRCRCRRRCCVRGVPYRHDVGSRICI